ncbi:SusC/RagA family TonB-linked outer membrane protein [Halosquirtibacter laminarini]|uniref:SusC/RagA family TonB-linked outer membrane protein n=1 Tax=Halosquirtibacter laminarini TaxID=3374600 RepID=A0AC61NG72_9BACT|nr:SusC/RagA family TonB-linked outer membrane protein [Prolixibacteraceae bacterium]
MNLFISREPLLRFRSGAITMVCIVLAIFTSSFRIDEEKLSFNNPTIKIQDVLNQIESKTSTRFIFKTEDLNTNRKLGTKFKNASAKDILDYIADSNDLVYSTSKNGLVVFKAQDDKKLFKGVVSDVDGQPLPGVTIIEIGTMNGVTTNEQGQFVIQARSAVFKFSFIGMSSFEQSLKVGSFNKVIMKEDVKNIDEVVVTALGIKRKAKVLSYEVQELDGDNVTQAKDVNFVKGIAGKVAGVTVNSSAAGLGGAVKIVMRGNKSISKNNNTLYVVDGVPLFNTAGDAGGMFNSNITSEGIADFNPEDIESMSVLTGPSAAALYGSYAANGVIIINTKQGKEGKLQLTYSNTTEFCKPFVTPRFQSTYGSQVGSYESWGTKLDQESNFDRMKFFQTGTNFINAVNLSVGTKKNQTFASIASTNSKGIVPNSEYNRYNVMIRNTSVFANDKMHLDLSANFIKMDNQNLLTQGIYNNPLVPLYLFPVGEDFDNVRMYERYNPSRGIKTQFWPYGTQGSLSMQNPYWIVNKNINTQEKYRYMLSAGLKYDITPWMNINARTRMDNQHTTSSRKLYASTIELFAGGPNGGYGISNTLDRQIYADALLNISKSTELFSLNINLGTSIIDNYNDSNGMRGTLLTLPNLFTTKNLDLKDQNTKIEQSGFHDQVQSVFANVELGFMNSFYLTGSYRKDWASMLAYTQNSAFDYPSVGLSAILSECIKMPSFIDFMKIRGSYSEVGAPPSRFLTHMLYNIDKGQVSTQKTGSLGELKPENTKSKEIGVDLKLFNNWIDLSASFYESNTYNQTFNPRVSQSSGNDSYYLQTGNIQNRGIEASLALNNKIGKLKWTSSFVYSLNRNEIVELVDNAINPITGESVSINEMDMVTVGSFLVKLKKGGSIGDIYTTNKLKEDNQGNIFVDPGSGKIDVVGDIQKVGSSNPLYNLGWRNNFTYKNFTLDFLINARVGGVVVSSTQAYMDRFGVSETSQIARDNGGIVVNGAMVDPQYYNSVVGTGQSGMASHYVYSATNVRLQELTLSYSLPNAWTKSVAKKVTLAFVGKNLFMFYNKAPFDPELAPSNTTYYQGIDLFMLPSQRSLGFNIKFNF